MPYNEQLAHRIRKAIALYPDEFTEKKMFGGLAFLYKGKMTVGIVKNELAVRVISTKTEKLLALPHVRPMDFTKKPMKEFIYINIDSFKSEEELLLYIDLGLEHAKTKLNEL